METAFVVCVFAVLAAGWMYFRGRLEELEERLRRLEWERSERPQAVFPQPAQAPTPAPPPAVVAPPILPAPEPKPAPRVTPDPVAPPPSPVPVAPPVAPPPVSAAPVESAAERPAVDWEATVGGSWLNKLGVLIFVIGLALALGYSFTRLGPGGRVAVSLCVCAGMLGAGAWLEPRERYAIFARGLLGGGWAGLYTTVYAMQAIPAALVVHDHVAGALLLISVSAGMIVHSLRYRSQTVTGLAYFIAFATLAITQVTWLSVLALAPLAGSLLFVAYRLEWRRLAILAVASSWTLILLRGDTGAQLLEVQAVLAFFWVMFECFDLLRPETFLLPLNAAGALGLSLYKWQTAAPDLIWRFFAGAAVAYLVSAVLRGRLRQNWKAAGTLSTALAAAGIFLRLHDQFLALGLLIEAELIYLSGVRLRAWYLRALGAAVCVLQVGYLFAALIGTAPLAVWVPMATLNAAVFYANRAICDADLYWGYGAAGMLAVVAEYEVPEPWRGRAWLALGAASFGIGWWKRLFDLRLQGYLLAALGMVGTALFAPHPPLALASGAAAGYALVLCAMRSGPDRFRDEEADTLRLVGSCAFTTMLAGLCWKVTPADYAGLAWLAAALGLLELGMRELPPELQWQAVGLAAMGAVQTLYRVVFQFQNAGLLEPRIIPVEAAIVAYAFSWRSTSPLVRSLMGATATFFLADGLWALLPAPWVAPAWVALALALTIARRGWDGRLLAAAVVVRYCAFGLEQPEWLIPMVVAIAGLYGLQLLSEPGSRVRTYFSLLATGLMTIVLWDSVSGSLLTVAWGMEGAVLLAAGFPLRDRVLRISGLALLFLCTLKLFLWDLRQLDTLPRIISFLVLGLILVAVSWVYTRFRERVARYL